MIGGRTLPPLLIHDESTNHLDLDAIESVEAGLRAHDGALLVVSHDETFLTVIGVTRRLLLELPQQAQGRRKISLVLNPPASWSNRA